MTTPARPSARRLPALVGAAKAIGHPVRLRILAMLRSGPLCVCQLTAVQGRAASNRTPQLAPHPPPPPRPHPKNRN
jgi:hypothetical protein